MYERQANRPHCPSCDRLMTAAKTIRCTTHYRCENEDCPNTTLLPRIRRELLDNTAQYHQANPPLNLAARDHMEEVG